MMAVNLLMTGRTGNGKSSTGNSILGRREFEVSSSHQSTPEKIVAAQSTIYGNVVNVVDGPAIGETDLTDPDDINRTLRHVTEALDLCIYGFSALLLCLKYGIRFTRQEKETVSLIRNIFGEHVFKEFGVIVITYGDSFATDNEEDHVSFEDWCRAQIGDFKELFEECGRRCVLFNNKAKDDVSIKSQRDTLLAVVAMLPTIYTINDYNIAEKGRKFILLRCKLLRVEAENKRVLKEIQDSLDNVNIQGNPERAMSTLIILQSKLDSEKHRLQTEAEKTDLLKGSLDQVKIFETNITTKINVAKHLQQLQQERGRNIDDERDNYPLIDRSYRHEECSCCQVFRECCIYVGTCICSICRFLWRRICSICQD